MNEELKILILEDDPGLNELIKRKLSRQGHQCFCFKKAEETLEWLTANSADIMILDLMLPDYTGEQLINILAKNNINIPFIIATGQGSEATAVKLLKKGAKDYLVKNSEFLNALPNAVEMVWREIQLERLLARAREQINIKNETLTSVFEFSPQGIIVIDSQGNIESYNKVLLEDLEISVPEMPETGTEFFNLAAEKSDSPEKFKSTIFNIDNETKGLLLEEITVNRKFFEIYTAPTQANLETPAGRIWYFRNITIHKKAAEAMEKAKTEVEKASEMRNRFFAVVSHDVKAPLSSIKGFSNLIKKNPNDKSVTEYLDIIDDSCDHLLALINDILDLTKIEQEKMDFHIQRFILTDLIKNCASSFSPQAEKKNIRINYSISDGLPEVIEGDLNRVKQIINNLLGNALKFTYEGSIDILVTKAEKPAFIRIDIRDTGIGMEKEKVKYIFNPFSQAGAEINSEFGGHGLGLAIAKNLVEKFGGEISAVSSPGEGSTFSFTIPCELKESF